jgi:hypothetical protein
MSFFLFIYVCFSIQNRHVVSVIHSIHNLSSCIRDYGLMFNYSTFSFESTMGSFFKSFFHMIILIIRKASFSQTIHGGSTLLTELIKNINLYRQASICLSSSFQMKGKEYVSRICSSPRQVSLNYRDDLTNIKLHQKLTSPPSNFFIQWQNLSQANILFYKTFFINDLRFSADDFTVLRRSNDACILYKSKNISYSIGFILCIVHSIDKNDVHVLLNKVTIVSTADTVHIQGRDFTCNNILKGVVVADSTTIILPSQITQKLAFRPLLNDDLPVSNSFLFFRSPNLSSFQKKNICL